MADPGPGARIHLLDEAPELEEMLSMTGLPLCPLPTGRGERVRLLVADLRHDTAARAGRLRDLRGELGDAAIVLIAPADHGLPELWLQDSRLTVVPADSAKTKDPSTDRNGDREKTPESDSESESESASGSGQEARSLGSQVVGAVLERLLPDFVTADQVRLSADEGDGVFIELTLPSAQLGLDRFQAWCLGLVSERLDEAGRNALKIAVQELGQNAIEWGNGLDADRRVRMAWQIDDERILVRISDDGEGFNPTRVPDPTRDPIAHIQAREEQGKRPGGFGIHLARRILDRVSWNKRGNSVVLEKRFRGVEA